MRDLIIAVIGLALLGGGFYYFYMKSEPAPHSAMLSHTYQNASLGFSIGYPDGYAVDADYVYQAMGPNKQISGVKFTIPSDLAAGTNLSTDSYVSVEQIRQTASCTAGLFLDIQNLQVQEMTEDGTKYSVAQTVGAGAGNRYEETVYALPGSNPCIAVRYFIHYGVIENYEPGAVTAFDRQALLAQFNGMRKSLSVQR